MGPRMVLKKAQKSIQSLLNMQNGCLNGHVMLLNLTLIKGLKVSLEVRPSALNKLRA